MEELLVTARSNDLIDPTLHIWTWEVAMYLFLGGVTAGIIIFAAVVPLLGKDRVAPFASDRLAILAPITLSLGMTIAVGVPSVRPGPGVDTEEDLQRAKRDLA